MKNFIWLQIKKTFIPTNSPVLTKRDNETLELIYNKSGSQKMIEESNLRSNKKRNAKV